MNAHTTAALALLAPCFQAQLVPAIRAWNLLGEECQIATGFRTDVQQDHDYAEGRTLPGPRVTNATDKHSNHCYGLAADIVPYITPSDPTKLNWNAGSPQFKRMVAIFKDHGLEWGGDWEGNLADYDHFQMGGLHSSPSSVMVADYVSFQAGKLTMAEIWSKAANGLYAAAPVKA